MVKIKSNIFLLSLLASLTNFAFGDGFNSKSVESATRRLEGSNLVLGLSSSTTVDQRIQLGISTTAEDVSVENLSNQRTYSAADLEALKNEVSSIKHLLSSKRIEAKPVEYVQTVSPRVSDDMKAVREKPAEVQSTVIDKILPVAHTTSLRDALQEWGGNEEWKLVWDAKVADIEVPEGIKLQRNYKSMVATISSIVPPSSKLQITMYEGDRVIYVHE